MADLTTDIPDIATASFSQIKEIGRTHALLAKMFLGDLRKRHRWSVPDFWPRGIDEAPDLEFASLYDEKTLSYVQAISGCLHLAQEAVAELELRSRPN